MANTKTRKKKGNTPVKKKRIKLFPPSRLAEIVFYSFVMFVLGVFTGRGMAPLSFDFDKQPQNFVQVKAQPEIKPVKVKVDFYRELDSDKEVEVDRTIIRQEEKFPLKIPVYKGEKKHAKLSSKLLSEEKKVDNNFKEPEKTENKKTDFSSDKGLFTVQIAAMKNKEDAELLAGKILKKGFPAYSVSGFSEDNVLWHRVRVGKYRQKKSAENIKQDLLQKLKINGIVLTIK
jgi:cell division septation protein DedD